MPRSAFSPKNKTMFPNPQDMSRPFTLCNYLSRIVRYFYIPITNFQIDDSNSSLPEVTHSWLLRIFSNNNSCFIFNRLGVDLSPVINSRYYLEYSAIYNEKLQQTGATKSSSRQKKTKLNSSTINKWLM